MILTIGGVATSFRSGTLTIEEAIDERSVCSFQVLDADGTKEYKKGQPITITNSSSVLVYAGYIVSAQRDPLSTADQSAVFYIVGTDNHYLADKKIIGKAYTSQTAGAIVRDIVTEKLAAEGVTYTATSVEDGPTIEEALFNYVSCSRAIDGVAGLADFWWEIDENKVLHFRARTSITAPWALAPADIVGVPSLTDSNTQYRNRQYIRGGKDITDPQTEISVGDGESRAFSVRFNIAKVPTVTISLSSGAWTAQTVGILGVDTGKNWYWNKGSNTISQDDAGTILTSSDRVRAVYQGEFAIVVISEAGGSILDRKTIEGTTGIVEHVYDDQNVSSRAAAFQIANAKLSRYSVEGKQLKFRTLRTGLAPGQLMTVNLPSMGLTAETMLITSVNMWDQGALLWYGVTAIVGPSEGGWARFFSSLSDKAEMMVLRENISESEVLITVETFSKLWTALENPNIFRLVYPSSTLYPGADTRPMFDANDRVKYMAWFDGTTELGRKQLTQQTDDATDLFTLTYLNPWEANTTMTHLGWFGGWQATDTIGTGVLVDKQAYAKTKTVTEAIQVEKTDSRWA